MVSWSSAGSLLRAAAPLRTAVRARGYKAPGGVTYPGGITYYPRFPDEKDPEYAPTKLFRVERIKPVKGNPYWLKKILNELKIHERDRVAIVKNIPEVNARLWKIKHLIKITPIIFPYGEPTEQDINYTVLKENGQCIVTKTLEIDQTRLEAAVELRENPKRMDKVTLKRDSRMKWMNPWSGGY